jgi:protein-tyrosine phosphatase
MDGYIKNNFGSRRGLYQYCKAWILQQFGYWNRYTDIPFDKVKRLIFICNGNICRSPLAEAVAREAN